VPYSQLKPSIDKNRLLIFALYSFAILLVLVLFFYLVNLLNTGQLPLQIGERSVPSRMWGQDLVLVREQGP